MPEYFKNRPRLKTVLGVLSLVMLWIGFTLILQSIRANAADLSQNLGQDLFISAAVTLAFFIAEGLIMRARKKRKLQKMEAVALKELGLGFESGSPEILKKLQELEEVAG